MASRRGQGIGQRHKKRLEYGVDIPTLDEMRAIIRTAGETQFARFRPFIVTAIFTGMRASELRGLRWSDVELDKARLHVRQRAVRYLAIGSPKSSSGQRTIPLTPTVVNTLREWKLACPKGELDLVFPNRSGKVESHPNIVQRALHPIQVAAGVAIDTGERDEEGNAVREPKYGLHRFRHWFASRCINRRADGGLELPAKAVQERLGHSTIMMTMDVYGHLFPAVDEADALAAADRSLFEVAGNAT